MYIIDEYIHTHVLLHTRIYIIDEYIHTHAHARINTHTRTHSPNSASGCCPSSNTLGNNTCVITGYESGLTIFPREAMETDQPYPFGIDPVSL